MSFLTIVIATIGRETLQRAVDSVSNQTIPCKIVIESDPERTGHGATLNRALDRVDTPWVGNLDDDDHLHPQYAELLISEIQNNPSADMIIFRMQRYINNKLRFMPPPEITDPLQLEFGNVGISFSLKTELAKKYRYMTKDNPEGYCPDWRMVEKVRNEGHNIVLSRYSTYFVEPPKFYTTI